MAQGVKLYRAIVESALYLAQVTRYGIWYAVNQLSRAYSEPSIAQTTVAKHLLRYLEGAPDVAVIYKRKVFAMHGYNRYPFPS